MPGTIWCRFHGAGETRYGIVEDDQVSAVEGSPFGEHRRTGARFALAEVKLLVPVIPGNFYCAGLNYAEHVIAGARRRGEEPKLPDRPEIGYRANSALIAHEEDIVKPKDATDALKYEAELVAVFGRTAKRVSREQALSCVFGWTIGNDVSEKTWQRQDRTFWRSKNTDTFKPMGPWIVTGLDPADMQTTVRINGEVTDSFATSRMIFDVADFLVEMTRYITIHPGDVMWLGTEGSPRNIAPGDVVEIDITGIGTLRNRVVAEA